MQTPMLVIESDLRPTETLREFRQRFDGPAKTSLLVMLWSLVGLSWIGGRR